MFDCECQDQTDTSPDSPSDGMDRYIGCKVIAAKKMDHHTFLADVKNQTAGDCENQPGYLVVYADGYKSWSPEGVFETAYRKVTLEEHNLLNQIITN